MTLRRCPGKLPSVVLVGRPNVGKSTLFNRITGSRRAIVAPVAGTTRDSLARPASWRGATFQLFDTGGMYGASEDPLHELVVRQGSGRSTGPTCWCLSWMAAKGWSRATRRSPSELRADRASRSCWRSTRPTTSARRRRRWSSTSWASSRWSRFPPSTARASADLLDEIVKAEAQASGEAPEPRTPAKDVEPRHAGPRAADLPAETRVAIVGRPNVGKSSLVNRLLKEERVLVSDMPGTTRDAIDAVADLASAAVPHRGHRRHAPARAGRDGGKVEVVSVAGAKKAIVDADVVALVIDCEARARPTRTRRSAAKPTAPAAASSSSPTNGIW